MKNFRILSRKIHNFFNKIFNNIRFRIESFNLAKIVILSWVILWIMSLFLIHIKSNNKDITLNIFNSITKFSAYFAICIYFIILFLLFSFNKKEKIKKVSLLTFRDYSIILFLSINLLLLALNNIFVINWLKIFYSEVYLWKWAILFLLSSFIIWLGSILLKKEYYNQNIVINDSTWNTEEAIKNNTKLPF